VENSSMLTSRGLGRVLGDLAAMGFDARWGVLGAADIGAPHQRDRMWIVAKWRGQLSHAQHNRIRRWEQQQEGTQEAFIANTRCKSKRPDKRLRPEGEISIGQNASIICGEMADTKSSGLQGSNKCGSHEQSRSKGIQSEFARSYGSVSRWWEIEPNVGRVVDGLASRVDRLKALGNGQVPLCAATAFRLLNKDI
jgi:DNA (cytosine-5)-methyltransferase 1